MEFILSAWNILNFRFHGSFSIIKLSIFVIRFSYVFLIPPPNVIERYLYDIGPFIISENGTEWKLSWYRAFSGPYSVLIPENTDQKQLCFWTLFTQCVLFSRFLSQVGWTSEKPNTIVDVMDENNGVPFLERRAVKAEV